MFMPRPVTVGVGHRALVGEGVEELDGDDVDEGDAVGVAVLDGCRWRG
jgi:hypothetical protein